MGCTILVDSYSETNKDASQVLRINHPSAGAGNSARGQCFTVDKEIYLCKAKFYLTRALNPDGVLKAYLYDITGTCGIDALPTGLPLAESDVVAMSGIDLTPTFVLVTFNFPDPKYKLETNHSYAIVVVVLDCTTCDASNNVEVGLDGTASTHDGNAFYYTGGAWVFSGDDTCFYVYGTPYVGGPYLLLDEDNIHAKTEDPKCIFPFNMPYARMTNNLALICKAAFDASYLPWEWWIDIADGKIYFDERKGEDKSDEIEFVARPDTDCNVHLGNTSRSLDTRQSVQRVRVAGKSEGRRQDEITSNWQEDETALGIVGSFYEEIISEKVLSGRETANEWAKVHREQRKNPIEEVEVEIERDPYPAGSWDVGDDVTLSDPKSRIATDAYRIKKATYRIVGDGEHITLTVTNAWKDITDSIADIYEKIKQLQLTGFAVEDWSASGSGQDKQIAEQMENLWMINRKYEDAEEMQEIDDPSASESYECNVGWNANGRNVEISKNELSIYGRTDAAGPSTTAVATEKRFTDWDQDPRFHVRLMVTGDMVANDDYIEFGICDSNIGSLGGGVTDYFIFQLIRTGAGAYTVDCMVYAGGVFVRREDVANLEINVMHDFEARIDWEGKYVFFNMDDTPIAVVELNPNTAPISVDDMCVMYISMQASGNGAGQAIVEFFTWKSQRKVESR